jgi:hypothetical protein
MRWSKSDTPDRPPLPADLRIVAAVSTIGGTTMLILLALGFPLAIVLGLLSTMAGPPPGGGPSASETMLVWYIVLLIEMPLLSPVFLMHGSWHTNR